jgi:hypothetical protein
MTTEETAASWAQIASAVGTATAAIFAAVTARRLRLTFENESRLSQTQQLKRIHGLISELAVKVHSGSQDMFLVQMELRRELLVTPLPLPTCMEIVTPELGDLVVSGFDAIASAAISEVETAQQRLWRDQVSGSITESGTITPVVSGAPSPRRLVVSFVAAVVVLAAAVIWSALQVS